MVYNQHFPALQNWLKVFKLTAAAATADSSPSFAVNQSDVGTGMTKPFLHRIHQQAIGNQVCRFLTCATTKANSNNYDIYRF